MKETGSGTTHYSTKKNIKHIGTAPLRQGKCGGGQRCKISNRCPFLTRKLEDLRKILILGSHYMMMMRNVCNNIHSNNFMSMNKTKFARQSFLDERDGNELKDNP